MGGETEQSVSGWTTDTLRTAMLAIIDAQEKAVRIAFAAQQAAMAAAFAAEQKANATALAAQEKAITKAEAATEKRFDAVNEFRGQLNDIIGTFMPRVEAEQRLASSAERLDEIKDRVGRMENLKAGGNERMTGIYAALGAVVAVLSIIVMAANGVFAR